MDIYLIIVIVLIAFAISDLVVGVSNDAVNFLNSAVGSKVAPMHVIMIVASLGVAIGATFSSGLMEVARSGIIHPSEFTFSEIMVIFLAVMVTDIILLDLFNTFGLPTSTTVSIVFELLGAAVAVSIIKISQSAEGLAELGKYINSAKALAIISGILLSVIIAFTVGAFVQFIARLVFTFSYDRTLKYYGAIYGGLSITAITFFMVIKGAKGASFINEDMALWLSTHTWHIIVYGFIGWTILLQVLHMLFKVSIPKVIVLFGTFALAFAFAGNDLVNFIGVPLAGYESYKTFIATPGAVPEAFYMGSLSEPVPSSTLYLIIAGVVMVVTLWFSKKAKTVIETEVNLGRQGSGNERFGTSALSRAVVRGTIALNKSFSSFIPDLIQSRIDKRFQIAKSVRKSGMSKEMASFDVIRASVNLVVAAALIALGTSLKLPLSTTYVTFMVAMGTSLSDRAWGRDSAVYRVQGVFSVIGGWFLTALIAFTVSFIFACIIYWGGVIAIGIVILLVIFLIYRTYRLHQSAQSEKTAEAAELEIEEITHASHVFDKCIKHTVGTLGQVPDFYDNLLKGLVEEDRQALKELKKDIKKFNKKTKRIKDNVNDTVLHLQIDQIDTGHYYVQSVDYLREIAHCLNYMINPAFEHIENNHTGLNEFQTREFTNIKDGIKSLYADIIKKIASKSYNDLDQLILKQQEILFEIAEARKNSVKRLKEKETHTRTGLLYFDLLAESKNLLLFSINLLKSQRDFIREIAKK
jgi:phosphate/sulfate permease